MVGRNSSGLLRIEYARWVDKLDLFVLKAIVFELETALKGSRIQRISQPDRNTVYLNCEARGRNTCRLAISADPDFPRLHLTGDDRPSPPEPPDFCRSMRNYLSGAEITRVASGEWERIVQITLERPASRGRPSTFALIAEIMGRWSNIVLVNGRTGRVIDFIKAVPEGKSRIRALTRNEAYQLPPEQKKLTPDSIEQDQFCRMASADLSDVPDIEETISWLVKKFRGLSPMTATEIAERGIFRGGGEDGFLNLWKEFSGVIQEMKESRYTPTIRLDDTGTPKILSALGFHAASKGEVRNFKSMNQAADYLFRECVSRVAMASLRESIGREISRSLKRTEKAMKAAGQDLRSSELAEEERLKGEVLLEELERVPEKSSSYRANREGRSIEIGLDPRFSPSENAQRYFRRYKKMKRRAVFAAERLKEMEREKMFLEGLSFDLDVAENEEDLEDVRLTLLRAGFGRKQGRSGQETKRQRRGRKRGAEKQTRPYRRFRSPEGWEIYVGKSALGNDFLVRRVGRENDWWFHAQGIPGCHVILRMPHGSSSSDPPDLVVRNAAVLAAYFSRGRGNLKMSVDCVPFQRIRRPRRGHPGQVIFSGHKSLVVSPDEAQSVFMQLEEDC